MFPSIRIRKHSKQLYVVAILCEHGSCDTTLSSDCWCALQKIASWYKHPCKFYETVNTEEFCEEMLHPFCGLLNGNDIGHGCIQQDDAAARASVMLLRDVLGKGKVVPVFFSNWAPRHKGVLAELRYSFTHSLTSALDGGEWSVSRPCRFTPRERLPVAHWIGCWVGPRTVLDTVVKRKIPSPRQESNPRTPIVQPIA
jgi:hypothetical protein